jgi:oxygen-dependent protoporphyrinogen oxidase
MFAGRAPEGRTVVRALLGGAQDQAALALSDGELVAAATRDLRELLGAIGPPLFARVTRWPGAMAQHEIGHIDRVAAIRARETAIPGLGLVGNGFEGVGIPDLCAQAEALAARWG